MGKKAVQSGDYVCRTAKGKAIVDRRRDGTLRVPSYHWQRNAGRAAAQSICSLLHRYSYFPDHDFGLFHHRGVNGQDGEALKPSSGQVAQHDVFGTVLELFFSVRLSEPQVAQ
jgi:hypothetical protein